MVVVVMVMVVMVMMVMMVILVILVILVMVMNRRSSLIGVKSDSYRLLSWKLVQLPFA